MTDRLSAPISQSMKTTDFDFQYPESQVATEPQKPSRIMYCEGHQVPQEVTSSEIFKKIDDNDLVIINNTKVVKKRVFTDQGLEILFLDEIISNTWTVLMPSKKLKVGDKIQIPGERTLTLIEKGLPQIVQTDQPLCYSYFEQYGHMALPPYIQKARGVRESLGTDDSWYQTDWAQFEGSSAAPTASLHFSKNDWENLKENGVSVEALTLHVGMGTFLPVHSDTLEEHKMHSEFVEIPATTLQAIERTKQNGGRVWALGTTVTRALESINGDWFQKQSDGSLSGNTDIFIYPGFEFLVVDVLMTNFHQPKSTLLALVSAFAGRERTLHNYQWAIDKGFRLFSYGDLSVWTKPQA